MQTQRRKRKGIVAGVAAAAILLAGSTFALWSAQEQVAGGTITAGQLGLTADPASWYDVSPDREFDSPVIVVDDDPDPLYAGEAISIGDFLVSPGDQLAATFDTTVTIQGDNLVAELSFEIPDPVGPPPSTTWDDLTLEYMVLVDGVVVVPLDDLAPTGSTSLGYFTDAANVAHTASTLAKPATGVTGGVANATVVVIATFDVDSVGYMNAEQLLENVIFKLEQVRGDGEAGAWVSAT